MLIYVRKVEGVIERNKMKLDTKTLVRETKKLKKYPFEKNRLDKILVYIMSVSDYKELQNNPFSRIYVFERLKHKYNKYYSFNLCKARSGKIRILCTIDVELNVLKIVYISTNHYKDFYNKFN